ncbi:hypothetical protein ACFOVU_14440, partial [Nocardiopsis sediminis]
ATRPVIEGKRLTELLLSYGRYFTEARVYTRLTPEHEPAEIRVTVRVWHRDPAAGPLPAVGRATTERRGRPRSASTGAARTAAPAGPEPLRLDPSSGAPSLLWTATDSVEVLPAPRAGSEPAESGRAPEPVAPGDRNHSAAAGGPGVPAARETDDERPAAPAVRGAGGEPSEAPATRVPRPTGTGAHAPDEEETERFAEPAAPTLPAAVAPPETTQTTEPAAPAAAASPRAARGAAPAAEPTTTAARSEAAEDVRRPGRQAGERRVGIKVLNYFGWALPKDVPSRPERTATPSSGLPAAERTELATAKHKDDAPSPLASGHRDHGFATGPRAAMDNRRERSWFSELSASAEPPRPFVARGSADPGRPAPDSVATPGTAAPHHPGHVDAAEPPAAPGHAQAAAPGDSAARRRAEEMMSAPLPPAADDGRSTIAHRPGPSFSDQAGPEPMQAPPRERSRAPWQEHPAAAPVPPFRPGADTAPAGDDDGRRHTADDDTRWPGDERRGAAGDGSGRPGAGDDPHRHVASARPEGRPNRRLRARIQGIEAVRRVQRRHATRDVPTQPQRRLDSTPPADRHEAAGLRPLDHTGREAERTSASATPHEHRGPEPADTQQSTHAPSRAPEHPQEPAAQERLRERVLPPEPVERAHGLGAPADPAFPADPTASAPPGDDPESARSQRRRRRPHAAPWDLPVPLTGTETESAPATHPSAHDAVVHPDGLESTGSASHPVAPDAPAHQADADPGGTPGTQARARSDAAVHPDRLDATGPASHLAASDAPAGPATAADPAGAPGTQAWGRSDAATVRPGTATGASQADASTARTGTSGTEAPQADAPITRSATSGTGAPSRTETPTAGRPTAGRPGGGPAEPPPQAPGTRPAAPSTTDPNNAAEPPTASAGPAVPRGAAKPPLQLDHGTGEHESMSEVLRVFSVPAGTSPATPRRSADATPGNGGEDSGEAASASAATPATGPDPRTATTGTPSPGRESAASGRAASTADATADPAAAEPAASAASASIPDAPATGTGHRDRTAPPSGAGAARESSLPHGSHGPGPSHTPVPEYDDSIEYVRIVPAPKRPTAAADIGPDATMPLAEPQPSPGSEDPQAPPAPGSANTPTASAAPGSGDPDSATSPADPALRPESPAGPADSVAPETVTGAPSAPATGAPEHPAAASTPSTADPEEGTNTPSSARDERLDVLNRYLSHADTPAPPPPRFAEAGEDARRRQRGWFTDTAATFPETAADSPGTAARRAADADAGADAEARERVASRSAPVNGDAPERQSPDGSPSRHSGAVTEDDGRAPSAPAEPADTELQGPAVGSGREHAAVEHPDGHASSAGDTGTPREPAPQEAPDTREQTATGDPRPGAPERPSAPSADTHARPSAPAGQEIRAGRPGRPANGASDTRDRRGSDAGPSQPFEEAPAAPAAESGSQESTAVGSADRSGAAASGGAHVPAQGHEVGGDRLTPREASDVDGHREADAASSPASHGAAAALADARPSTPGTVDPHSQGAPATDGAGRPGTPASGGPSAQAGQAADADDAPAPGEAPGSHAPQGRPAHDAETASAARDGDPRVPEPEGAERRPQGPADGMPAAPAVRTDAGASDVAQSKPALELDHGTGEHESFSEVDSPQRRTTAADLEAAEAAAIRARLNRPASAPGSAARSSATPPAASAPPAAPVAPSTPETDGRRGATEPSAARPENSARPARPPRANPAGDHHPTRDATPRTGQGGADSAPAPSHSEQGGPAGDDGVFSRVAQNARRLSHLFGQNPPGGPPSGDQRAPGAAPRSGPVDPDPDPGKPSLQLDHGTGEQQRLTDTPAGPPAARRTHETPAHTADTPGSGGTRGWRRLARVVTGGSAAPAKSDLPAGDLERLRAPLGGARSVVVLGCTGGAGQTITTLMLGHTLAAHRDHRVVAVDVNPSTSGLSRRVRAETPETLTSLLANSDSVNGYLGMRRYTSQSGTGLEVVSTLDDPYVQTLDDRDYAGLAGLLEGFYEITLLDPAATGVARALPVVDGLVLVAPASEDAARSVAMTFEWLDGHGYASLRAKAIVVINGVSKRSLGDVDEAEKVARGRCRAIVRVPWDDHLAAGKIVDVDALRATTRRAHAALGGVLVHGLAGGTGAGPVPPGAGAGNGSEAHR